jgi:hypothetical protein
MHENCINQSEAEGMGGLPPNPLPSRTILILSSLPSCYLVR